MMAGAVDQRVLQALELVYAADTPVAQRREAEDVCQQLRESAQGPAYGVQLARASNGYSPMARHFGLQLIEHALRYRWGAGKKGGQLGSDECLQLRDQVWELVFDACPRPGSGGGGGGGQRDPQYISEKLVAVLAMLVIRLWPSAQWADLSAQLLHLYTLSAGHRELALRVWQTLGEELFVYDRDTAAAVRRTDLTNGIIGALLPRAVVAELYPSGYRLTTDPAPPAQPAAKGKVAAAILLEPGNEDGWILRWLQHAGELAQQGAADGDNEALLCALVDTTATFLEWLPIKALVATGLVPRLAALLGVRSSGVRQRVAAALATASKRVAATGDDRDAVLLQFVQADGGSAVAAMAHTYATTLLGPAVDAEWGDAADALAAAQSVAQTCANLVTLHWARPKLEANVVAQPEPFVELLMALVRDPRHSVSSLALTGWAALVKHATLSRVPAVSRWFSGLTECTTEALFRVCRAAHVLADGDAGRAGIDEAEADQFDSAGELRMFLTTVARARILGIVRGMCALDPAGFVQWILPSLLPVFAQAPGAADVARVSAAEAALMIVDTILTTLDDAEQRALEDGGDALAQIQAAREPCYRLGQLVVQLGSDDVQLQTRQLQTLPSFAFLLRPAAMDRPAARALLLAVLQRCAVCLRFPLDAPNVRDLRQTARRATAALVRIALAVPDSLMMVYADLQQLVRGCLADPGVVGTVKSYLTEFQLTLIAGASCTLAERTELARPVLRPLVDELCAFRPMLHTPADFAVLLGLPALDQACVHGAAAARAALEEARGQRNGLTHVLSTLFICLSRTLGDAGAGAGDHRGLAPLWGDYVAEVVPVLLLAIRSLHALWSPEHWRALPWQSAQAQANLFGLLDMSPAERQAVAGVAGPADDAGADVADVGSPLAVETRAMHHTLATLREYAYKCLGRLAHSPDAFSAARIPDVAANFTGCLFADVQHMAPRHWRVLLGDVVGPILGALGNWPGQGLDAADSVRVVGGFAGAWLEPLFAFCAQHLDAEWRQLRARGIASAAPADAPPEDAPSSVTDDMIHEKVVRDWTRAWAQHVLGRLLASVAAWLPDASQIEHELASSARIAPAPAPPRPAAKQPAAQGSRALGAYILGTPSALAGTLAACLGALKYNDTAAASRVVAQLAALAPSLLLASLMPMYHPPTPAHASTVGGYGARIRGADLLAWLAGDLPAALVGVLRDASLIDLQDAALALLADLAYTSAALEARMPVHWPFRGSSGDDAVSVGDPGLLYRQSLLRVVQAAGGAVDEAEPALAQIAASSAAEGKRRRALLKIALQPLLAVEKSQLFSEPQAARRTPAGSGPGKHAAPASWTNRHGGQPTSVLDADPQFDMGALMP